MRRAIPIPSLLRTARAATPGLPVSAGVTPFTGNRPGRTTLHRQAILIAPTK